MDKNSSKSWYDPRKLEACFKLTCFRSSEKNRLQNCLTVSNIQLGNVVSDTFGKSAQAILDKILENPADTSFDLEPLVFKSLKKKLPELHDAIDGYITPEQAGLTPTNNESAGRKNLSGFPRLEASYRIISHVKERRNYNAELYRKSDLSPVDREITLVSDTHDCQKSGL